MGSPERPLIHGAARAHRASQLPTCTAHEMRFLGCSLAQEGVAVHVRAVADIERDGHAPVWYRAPDADHRRAVDHLVGRPGSSLAGGEVLADEADGDPDVTAHSASHGCDDHVLALNLRVA